MQAVLSSYPNLDIRKAAVQDIVLSPPVEGEDARTGRKIIGLRLGTFALLFAPWSLGAVTRCSYSKGG